MAHTLALAPDGQQLAVTPLRVAQDGIVQNAILGTKTSGRLEPVWNAAVETGAITKW